MPDWSLEPVSRESDAPPAAGAMPPAGRRRPWARLRPVWMAAGLALVVAGALIGFYLARWQSGQGATELSEVREDLGRIERALSKAEERNWEYYLAVQALMAENALLQSGSTGTPDSSQEPASITPEEPLAVGGAYDDGVYLVGEDIFPGAYDGAVTAGVGYWARLRATDGAVGSIITNAVARGPFVLTIVESDKALELRGVEITPR